MSPVGQYGEYVRITKYCYRYDDRASLFDYVFDDAGNIIGYTPRMETRQRVKMEPTKIPYYYPAVSCLFEEHFGYESVFGQL